MHCVKQTTFVSMVTELILVAALSPGLDAVVQAVNLVSSISVPRDL